MTDDRWKNGFWAAVLIAFACMVVTVVFVVDDYRDDREARDRTTQARLSACLSFNEDVQANVNALNDRTQELLDQTFNGPGHTPRTPAKQAEVDAYLEQQKAAYDAVKIAERDCTPAAIEEFYEGERP